VTPCVSAGPPGIDPGRMSEQLRVARTLPACVGVKQTGAVCAVPDMPANPDFSAGLASRKKSAEC
jgi:hypothetical protein